MVPCGSSRNQFDMLGFLCRQGCLGDGYIPSAVRSPLALARLLEMLLPESADWLHERLGVGHDVDTVRKPDGGQNEIFWDPLEDTHNEVLGGVGLARVNDSAKAVATRVDRFGDDTRIIARFERTR